MKTFQVEGIEFPAAAKALTDPWGPPGVNLFVVAPSRRAIVGIAEERGISHELTESIQRFSDADYAPGLLADLRNAGLVPAHDEPAIYVYSNRSPGQVYRVESGGMFTLVAEFIFQTTANKFRFDQMFV